MRCPCRDCENRTERCHSLCEEYREWKEEREKQKQSEKLDDIWRRGIYTERKRKK